MYATNTALPQLIPLPTEVPLSIPLTMDAQNGAVHPRKRRRRRRLDRPPISARLLLDDRMKGEVGILSEDLFNDLFPAAKGKSAGMWLRVPTMDAQLT